MDKFEDGWMDGEGDGGMDKFEDRGREDGWMDG